MRANDTAQRPIIGASGTLRARLSSSRRRSAGLGVGARPPRAPRPRRPPPRSTTSPGAPRRPARRAADEAAALYRQALARTPQAGPRACGRSGRSPTSRTGSPSAATCSRGWRRSSRRWRAAWALRGLCEFRLGAYAARASTSRTASRWACRRGEALSPACVVPPGTAADAARRVRPRHRAAAARSSSSSRRRRRSTWRAASSCCGDRSCRGRYPRRTSGSSARPARRTAPTSRATPRGRAAIRGADPEAPPGALPALRPRPGAGSAGLGRRARGSSEGRSSSFRTTCWRGSSSASALLARGREAEAIAPAEEAVRLAPGLFVTHLVLGRALAATGGLERGIRELETAAALAAADPGHPTGTGRVPRCPAPPTPGPCTRPSAWIPPRPARPTRPCCAAP